MFCLFMVISKESSNLLLMNRLQEYPFESHYHDEGEKQAPVLVFLHGVPTWSYTFRRIIPACVAVGYRVVVPDLPGFGLSEKPTSKRDFTLYWLLNLIKRFMGFMDLKQPVLFAQDWGAVLGMLLAAENENLFSGMILCNGLLPVPGMKTPKFFRFWKFFARFSPILPVGMIVNFGSKRRLSRMEKYGYNFPYGSNKQKKAIRWMPQLLPIVMRHSNFQWLSDAWSNLDKWTKPVLTIFSDGDPITQGGEKIIQKRIPGARDQDHVVLTGGHFLQEDASEEISRRIIRFMKKVG